MKIAQINSPFKGINVRSSGGIIDVNTTDIGGLITAIVPYIFSIAAILLLIYLVTAGLSMMLSRGDPKAIQSAQSRITNALIGFVIVIVAFFIVQLLGRILGLQVNVPFKEVFGL